MTTTTLLAQCTFCGGDLFHDVLEDEWFCVQSGHRFFGKEKVEAMMANGRAGVGHDPPVPECRIFQLSLYIHTERISASQGGGVRAVQIEMMIIRQANRKGWRIEYLDLGPIKKLFGQMLRGRGIYAPLYTAACEALAVEGIYPQDIRGWSQWFRKVRTKEIEEKRDERSNGCHE